MRGWKREIGILTSQYGCAPVYSHTSLNVFSYIHRRYLSTNQTILSTLFGEIIPVKGEKNAVEMNSGALKVIIVGTV
jgi:hypothetical protein